jgi:biopolymer transport protein ExbD
MLTSSFRAPEPIIVDPPSSTTEVQIPRQVFLITLDSSGRTFVDITNNAVKIKVLKKLFSAHNIPQMSEEDYRKFAGAGPIGLKLSQIKGFVELESSERNSVTQNGIPYDTTGKTSELFEWAHEAMLAAYNDFKQREQDAKDKNLPFDPTNFMKFVVKADADARYDVVKKVVQVFRDAKIKEFQMITGLEKSPQD